jgi:hypothetical protein
VVVVGGRVVVEVACLAVVEGPDVVDVVGAGVVVVVESEPDARVVPVVVDVPFPSAERMPSAASMSSEVVPIASPGTVVNWMPSTVDATGLEGPVSASAATNSAPPRAAATMTRRAHRFTKPASNRSSTSASSIARRHYTRCWAPRGRGGWPVDDSSFLERRLAESSL